MIGRLGLSNVRMAARSRGFEEFKRVLCGRRRLNTIIDCIKCILHSVDVESLTSRFRKWVIPLRNGGLVKLPPFVWLKVDGKAGHDDFGLAEDHRLVVSESVLDALRPLGISHALIEPF